MHTLSNRISSTVESVLCTLVYFLPGSSADWRPGILEEGWGIVQKSRLDPWGGFSTSTEEWR
jgi:hypothetical protein